MSKERLLELRSLLHEHNHRYYVLHQPTISDYQFDSWMKELEALETFFLKCWTTTHRQGELVQTLHPNLKR